MLKAIAADLVKQLPGPVSDGWPDGERYLKAFEHGSMLVEVYKPVGHDPQTPHEHDELYFIISGTGEIVIGGARAAFTPGMAFFVAANVVHRFENFSADFTTWVVFWGPQGGEAALEK